MRRLLPLLLLLCPLLAFAAAPTARPGDKVVTRVWSAGDGQGGVRLLWFVPPQRWGHGWRVEDDSGRVLARRIVPATDFDAGKQGGAIVLGMKAMSDWDFARSAGLAVELQDLPPRRTGFVLRRLDARGEPDGAWLKTTPIDLASAAPPPRPPKDLSAEATAAGVKLYWRPNPGLMPLLAYTVARDDGRAGTQLSSHSSGRPKNDLAPTGGGSDAFAELGAQLTRQPVVLGNDWAAAGAAFIDLQAPTETEVVYQVRGIDLLGRVSAPVVARVFVPDFTALNPPRGLQADSVKTPVRLRWLANASVNTQGYLVERAFQTAGPWEVLNPRGGRPTEYTDREAQPGSTLFYRLRAIDPRGDVGEPGLPLPVNARGEPPAAPRGLAAEVGNSRVRLVWRAAAGAAAYHVERRAGEASAWSRLTTTPTPETRYDDVYGGSPGGRFEYRVYAVAPDEQTGEASAALSVALPDTVPPPPPQVTATSGENGRVRLAFRAAAPAEDTVAVLVLRGADAEDPGLVIGDPVPVARGEFIDTWVDAGKNYVYRLVALDAAGNRGDPGPAVKVRVGAPPLGVPERPEARYLAEPFPHVKLTFTAPPRGLAVLVEAGEGDRWRSAAGPVAGNEAIDLAPRRGAGRYRLRYQSANGGVSEASAEVGVHIP